MADWISSGQLYMLYYDGIQFIAFPMSASSESSSSSVEFADFSIEVLNLDAQSSESDISSAFGGPAKMAEFDALVQAGTKIIRFTNVDSFVYYTAIYYKHVSAENSTINDIVVVLHDYTDRTNLEMFTFLGTMTEDGDFEKYTAVVKDTLYSSNQDGTLNNPRAFTGDANTKTTPGVYAITPFSNVPSNIPSGVSYGTMIVTTDENASTITQTLQTSNTVYFRCKYSTNDWGEWVDLGASGSGGGSSSNVGTILNPKTLTSSDDLNNIKTSGTYTYTTSSSPSNTPNGTGYGTLIVNKLSDNEVTQIVISPDFSEGSSSKSSNIWFRNYGTRDSNQQSGVPEWSNWNMLLMTDYGNKYRYIKPYLLSYYDFNSLDSDSTQTDIENAFGSLEDEQEFIAAMNDENTNIILYYDHESNEREYWYTISKMVDSGKYHRLVLCRGNSSENMTADSISFIIYSFKYDDINNVYTAFSKYEVAVPSSLSGTIVDAKGLYSGSTGMNALYEPGVYNIRSDESLQNYPTGAGTGTLLTFAIGNLYIIQMLLTSTYLEASNPTKVYFRGCRTDLDGAPLNDTWSEWSLANTTYSNATTTTDGLMSKEDKIKLNGIATGATTNTASTTIPKANGTAAVGTDSRFARGDHVHPAQTTITGNAGSATKLQTARTINGVSFDGSKNITVGLPTEYTPQVYRLDSNSGTVSVNTPGGTEYVPLEKFPMYNALGNNTLFTLESDGTITVNKTCMLEFRGTYSVYSSGSGSTQIGVGVAYYDNDIQWWMSLYGSEYSSNLNGQFGPGQLGLVTAGTKIRAVVESNTSGWSGTVNGFSLFINVLWVDLS